MPDAAFGTTFAVDVFRSISKMSLVYATSADLVLRPAASVWTVVKFHTLFGRHPVFSSHAGGLAG